MQERYIEVKNPTGGEITIEQGYTDTAVTCHWPISTGGANDWIDIKFTVDSRDYMWAIRCLLERGRGKVEATGGNLTFESVGSRTRLHVGYDKLLFTATYLCDLPARAFGPDLD
jgi:hypothetical protein